MFIVYGAYHYWPKRVAFRNDYCLACKAPRRAIAVRTFDVGHIFWIPIFPVGFWKHWKCVQCGRNPHVSLGTRRSFKWVGLMILIAIAAIAWLAPVESNDDIVWRWILRVAPPIAAIFLVRHLWRTRKEPSLKQSLATVQAATDVVCPFCVTPLVPDMNGHWSCPSCGSTRR